MTKKFFYNHVYSAKRTIINSVIIGICIIGLIFCFTITSSFEGKSHITPESSLSIKSKVTVEINEEISKDMFFSKIENVNLNDIDIEYPDTFNSSIPGKYDVILKIEKKNYKTNLVVVDTTKPTLALKTLTITKGKNYTANDFVIDCKDNSSKKCNLSFYINGIDEDGNIIDYSNFTEAGTYSIKISAKDESGNQIVKETKLVIKKNTHGKDEYPTVNCKYGNNAYNEDKYLLALDVSNNSCAVKSNLYNNNIITKEINKLMESEKIRINKDISKLNLKGENALSINTIPVSNVVGKGFVGYEIRVTGVVTNNEKDNIIFEYKINTDGKRVFIINPYNLPN